MQRFGAELLGLCEMQLGLTKMLDLPVARETKLYRQSVLPAIPEHHVAEI